MTRKKKLLIWLGVVLALCDVLFLARGWLRGTVSPIVTSFFYKNSVNTAFRESFEPIDARLREHGVTFRGGTVAEAVCDNTGYEAWTMTNSCDIIQQSNSIPLHDGYKKEWQRSSKELERYLHKNGWRQAEDTNRHIDKLFEPSPNLAKTATSYKKEHAGTTCILSFVHTAADPNVFYANRECHRSMVFFGDR